jgi:Family of unknown function (DUF5631)/Family of unknown function (DUF5632)
LAGVRPAVSGLPGGGVAGGGSAGVSPAVSGLPGGGVAGGGSAGPSSTTNGPVVRAAGLGTTPGFTPATAPPPAAPAPGGPPLAAGIDTGGVPHGGPPAAAPPPGGPPLAAGIDTGGVPHGGPPPAAPPPGGPPLAAGIDTGGVPPAGAPLAAGFNTGGVSAAATPFATSHAPSSMMFNPANVGITPGPASGALNAAAWQGIAPPNMMPTDFSHHGEAGLMPPGAGGIPPTPPIAPQVAPTPVSPTTAPTAGSGDWHSAIPAEQPSAPQASSPSYSSPAASSSTSTSSPTNAGYMSSTSAPSTSYSGGALPSYGSDLRPPAASVPAGSPSPPPSVPNPPPTPGSPSTSPAAGSSSGVAHAGTARSDSAASPSSQQPAPTGIAGKAVVAGAGGAVAGAASADATSRIRLQRIVDAVARQEARLAWAAGDRPDDTTILLTDLADGWIPPGIEIPASVTLLEPGRRRGDLEALLGEVRTAVTHTPDRYVPEADESVPTSPRPRHAPEIEELGWELSSATHWRDGLPRLAHTLAKAASSGTGVDPSEVELLQQQMHDVGESVLDAYPDDVDPKHVGNWQLLAAIEALIRGDKVGANYHLAWFQACMTSPIGPQR